MTSWDELAASDFQDTNFGALLDEIEGLAADAVCPLCNDAGLILCTDHGIEPNDFDGDLCWMCSQLRHGEPGLIHCPCYWLGRA